MGFYLSRWRPAKNMSTPRTNQDFRFSDCSDEKYHKVIDKIYSLVNFEHSDIGKSRDEIHLKRITDACQLLGNPQKKVPTIHVAGTKGKGSTAALIAAILQGSGYKVGLYTSPHLQTLRERIQINFSPIGEGSLVELAEKTFPILEKNWKTQKPLTFFETMTLFSFVHFASNNVDFQVIETGIGGRLDATNVVDPCLSVITPISIDHTNLLGETVELIAQEKAGIIKPETPVVVSGQKVKALKVLHQVAGKQNARLINTQSEIRIKTIKESVKGQQIEYTMGENTLPCFLPLIGQHQSENLATALVALKTLGVSPEKGLKKAVRFLKLPGRLQLLETKSRLFILDVAHNSISIQKLTATIKKTFKNYSFNIIFGMTAGHDADSVLIELAKLNPTLFPVEHFHPKAVNPEDIAQKAISHGVKVCYNKSQSSIETVLKKKFLKAKEKDLVIVTGSFSVVGEAMGILRPSEAKENLYEHQLNINKILKKGVF